MFTCGMLMVGKSVRFKVLVVGWMTHGLVADDPPNDPQYGMEHQAESCWWAPTGHHWGDGCVFKAMVACQTFLYMYLWPMCFFFSLCANFMFVSGFIPSMFNFSYLLVQ